ncbi:DUF1015 family protein [Neolewinella litorea]|uniref:DUF1015 family protein n=1 Tax=Neolewinella litorea TaxID=2562452 RepID=A0A4S4NKU6_9BACT|nr:DUF1015 family protein [Neolewinella litorea]THH40459.1 DUF1015 family protein [Neolewinella litorea]
MTSALYPFPRFYHPAPGIHETLPVTRDGIRQLSPFPFTVTEGPSFPRLSIRNGENGRTAHGICGLLPASTFSDGTVRPHERTLTARLNRQQRLVSSDRGALGKPVLLTTPSLDSCLSALSPGSEEDQVIFYGNDHIYRLHHGGANGNHPLEVPGTLVIADGHHRAYTHAQLADEGDASCSFIPVVIVGADELHIGTFLRLIDGEGRSVEELQQQLTPYFNIRPLDRPVAPAAPGHWLLSFRNAHFELTKRENTLVDTDPGWLNLQVLPHVFGIHDTRTDARITSVDPPPLVDGAVVFSPDDDDKIKLLGFPLSRQSFFSEVEAGRTLPPKSTRFEPRVPSGLLVWMP